MIEKIIEFSARNQFVIFLLVAFLVVAGIWAVRQVPLDAIPDLTDTQVIIFTEWMGRSPNLVEDQVTYPIVSAMLSAPRVKVGQRVDGRREILSGVSEGDLVVTSGNFLIDSESRLKAALRGMEEMPGMPGMDHKPGTNAAAGTQPGAAPSTGSGQVVPDEGSKPMEMPESPPPAPPAGHAGHGM